MSDTKKDWDEFRHQPVFFTGVKEIGKDIPESFVQNSAGLNYMLGGLTEDAAKEIAEKNKPIGPNKFNKLAANFLGTLPITYMAPYAMNALMDATSLGDTTINGKIANIPALATLAAAAGLPMVMAEGRSRINDYDQSVVDYLTQIGMATLGARIQLKQNKPGTLSAILQQAMTPKGPNKASANEPEAYTYDDY